MTTVPHGSETRYGARPPSRCRCDHCTYAHRLYAAGGRQGPTSVVAPEPPIDVIPEHDVRIICAWMGVDGLTREQADAIVAGEAE